MNTAKILIVDDERDICHLIQGILEDEGYETLYANSSKEAKEKLSQYKCDLVILDVWLQTGSSDGLELLDKIMDETPNMPVVMISGHSTIEIAVSAIKNGAYDFLEKPFKTDRLLVMLKRALEFSKLKDENQNLRQTSKTQPTSITGKSNIITGLKQEALRTAVSNSRILITGEQGTGKKNLARFIHQNSSRKDKPCIIVPCTEANDEATVSRFDNALISASSGTIVFDEIGRLSSYMQDRLSQYLKTGQVNNEQVDVRIISLASPDLEKKLKEGRFKTDLFYRLNVVPLSLPRLRERMEDIEILMDAFHGEFSKTDKNLSSQLGSSAMIRIRAYDWPGNNRQLKNFVEWLNITGLADKDKISADELPDYLSEKEEGDIENDGLLANCVDLPLREARENFEIAYLQSQIMRFGGNISKTADFIGMERSALHRKIRSLNINTNKTEEVNDTTKNVVKAG